ncbi:MAG: hypothetical protein JNM29_00630 [Candidatus Odyssella sp.]|nr:hypothetical protein [Candidatus Odyssella sp.]
MNARDRLPAALLGLLTALAPLACRAETGTVPKPLSLEWAGDPPKIEDRCEAADLRYATAPLFRIAPARPGDRVYLLARKEACAAGARCPHRQRSYLVAGDAVFGGPADRGFRCVYYGSRRGELIAGFVPAQSLAPLAPQTALDRAFLLGNWRRDAASRIAIRAAGAAGIAASGEGHWKGVASVNVGEFHATADAVSSPVLVLREGSDGCAVALERRGPYLLANDNERCGGHNVRFVGIYIRQTAR